MSALALLLLLSILDNINAKYSVETWNTTITNHEANIPLNIYYPSNTDHQYPVIIFHHGFNCKISYYNYIWQRMVPTGAIVIMLSDYMIVTNQTACAISMRFTLDWVHKCNTNASSPLYQLVGDNVIAGGHSYGGGVAYLCASTHYDFGHTFEYTFDAVFTLAGGAFVDYFLDLIKTVDIPILMISASHDCINPPNDTFFNAIPSTTCKFVANIANGTHCNFMDAPTERQASCDANDERLCTDPSLWGNNIALDVQMDIVIGYISIFMDNNEIKFEEMINKLKGDTESGVLFDSEYECGDDVDIVTTNRTIHTIFIIFFFCSICGVLVGVSIVIIRYLRRRMFRSENVYVSLAMNDQ